MTNKQEPTINEISATDELNRFCKEYDLVLELEKPFEEFNKLRYRVADKEGNTVKSVIIEDMDEFNKNIEIYAGTLLNKASQEYPKRNK